MQDQAPPFRPGDVLATAFTGTLSERYGVPVERLPTPARLVDWLVSRDLEVGACSEADLRLARRLREAVHACATAATLGEALPPDAVAIVDGCSGEGRATSSLTPSGEQRWRLGSASPVRDALGVVAADAIGLVAGQRPGRLAQCASPTCRAVFLDTSQSRSRRWCDMNTCGNRQKKARYRGTPA